MLTALVALNSPASAQRGRVAGGDPLVEPAGPPPAQRADHRRQRRVLRHLSDPDYVLARDQHLAHNLKQTLGEIRVTPAMTPR